MRSKGQANLKVHHLPLGRRAADVIRQEIVSGRFPPGYRLVESGLAELLEVSRGTIRSALSELANKGLVEQVAYTKWCVPVLAARDAWQLCTLRAALEALAANLAADSIKVGGREALQQSFESLVGAAAAGNSIKVNNADVHLHKTIVALAGNKPLLMQYELIEQQIRRYIVTVNALTLQPRDVAEQHRPLVDAILAGIPDKAEVLAKAHTLGEGRRLYDYLRDVEHSGALDIRSGLKRSVSAFHEVSNRSNPTAT